MAGRDLSAELFGDSAASGRDLSAELFGAEPTKEQGFMERAGRAAKRGLEALGESATGIALGAKAAVGAQEAATAQAEQIRKEAEAQRGQPMPITWDELEQTYGKEGAFAALKKMPAYVAEQILQSAPSMAVPLGVGAAAGAVSGPLAPIVAPVAGIGTYGLQQFGQFMKRQAEEGATGETLAPGKAALTAAVTAPIGYLADRLTLGLGKIPEKVLGEQIAKELAKRTGATVAGRVATGATVGVIAEAPTEVLEQAAERWQAGLPLKDEEAIREYKEAFFGAAAVGGVGGAGARVFAKPATEVTPPPEVKPTEEPVAEKPLALGMEKPFTPVVFPDGSVATTPEEVARYEEQQFQKKYEPQPVTEPEKEPLRLGVSEPFTPVVFPDGSVATNPEDVVRYEEEQFKKKYAPQKIEVPEPFVEEPVGPSLAKLRASALMGGETKAGGELAALMRAKREETEAKAEVPVSGPWEFLFQQKQRLLTEPKTKERDATIGRIDDELLRLGTAQIEQMRKDAEAAKTSVFAEKELPPVQERAQVMGEEALAQLQAKEGPAPTETVPRGELGAIRALEKTREEAAPATELEMQLAEAQKAKNQIKSTNLRGALQGKLAVDEVADIAPGGKGYENLSAGKTGGTYISELISDGSLNDYLPPHMRPESSRFDAQESAEYIKDKLRNKNNLTFDAEIATKQADDAIASLEKEIRDQKEAQVQIAEATGMPMFRRRVAVGKSIGKDTVQKVIYLASPHFVNKPEIVTVDSLADPLVPESVRRRDQQEKARGAKGEVQGFFHDGKVYLVSGQIESAKDALETLVHESVGHFGLRGVFGKNLDAVLQDIVKHRRADVKAVADANGLDMNNANDQLKAAEEVLADMAESKPGISFVRRAISAIRNWLRDMGFKVSMTDEDIIQKVILPARKFVGEIPESVGERENILGQKTLGNWAEPTDTKIAGEIGKDDIIYYLQDKLIDTKRIVQAITQTAGKISSKWNPYLQEELYHGRTAKQTKDFLQNELRPLMQEMDRDGISMGELETYLHNRHAEAYNAQVAKVNPDDAEMQDGGSGIATADAKKYLANLPSDKKAKFESLAKRIDSITKGTRKVLVESGLEKPETIQDWEKAFPDYVPLHREDVDFQYTTSSTGTGQGFDVRGPFSRRAMGSKRKVVDILANIAMQRERAIVKANKNRVSEAVYGLAAQNPNPDFWLAVNPDAEKIPEVALDELRAMGIDEDAIKFLMKEPKQRAVDPKKNEVVNRINATLRNNDSVLSVRVNGENRYVFFNPNNERSARAAKALKNLDAEQLSQVLGTIARITRWMSSINTQYNPIFGAVNFLRDIQGAAIQLSSTPLAGKQKEVAANVIPALKSIYSSIRAEREGKTGKGEMAKLWNDFQEAGGQTGFRDMFSRSQERAEALQNELNQMSEGKVKKAGRAVFDWLSDYNDTMENAVRLSAYKVAIDSGISPEEAASIAKNLTVNFNRKGQIATQAGALYAFFNAAVQGTTRLAQTMTGPAGKKIMAGGLLLGTMQAALLAMAGFDEEEPPEFVRERNVIIPVGSDKYITVPMPLGYHVIPGISRILTEWALSGFKDTPDRIASLTGMLMEAFNPIGNAGWSVQTIAPTFADPLVALTENKDWTGKPIARKDFSNLDPTPGYTRAKDSASWFSTELAKFLNFASGGTKYQPGIISPTPDQLDYLIGQATGGVGRELLKVEQTIGKTYTGEELPPYKIPVVGRFYGETKSSAAESGRFYKNLEHLNRLENEIKGRRENQEPVADFIKDNPEVRLVKQSKSVYEDIKKLKDRKEKLMERGASREMIQTVEKQITTKMRLLNEQVERLKK